jgi:hypothetical protein
MKRVIMSAEASEDTRLKDMIDVIEDDFDYAVSGLEKLDRDGGPSRSSGIEVANELHAQLTDIIAQIADIIGGEE